VNNRFLIEKCKVELRGLNFRNDTAFNLRAYYIKVQYCNIAIYRYVNNRFLIEKCKVELPILNFSNDTDFNLTANNIKIQDCESYQLLKIKTEEKLRKIQNLK
jgi:hypothetical protein